MKTFNILSRFSILVKGLRFYFEMANAATSRTISIIIYVIFIVFLVIAIWAERKDVHCSQFEGGKCGAGMGSAYADGRPLKYDNVEDLLKKAKFTARYELNSITWRRVFIPALISAFVVMYVAKKRVPHGLQLAIGFLTIYITFYLTLTLFQGWIAQPALKQLDQILQKVNSKSSSS
jgi:hypothetical protein